MHNSDLTTIRDWRSLGKFGLETNSIELRADSTWDVKILRMLLSRHGILVFRNQLISDYELIRFGRLIGNGVLEPSARKISHGQIDKHVAYLTNLKGSDGIPLGFGGDTTDFWHSDQEFRENPASLAVLYCVIPAPIGGETCFATTAVRHANLRETRLPNLRELWSTRRPAKTHDNVPMICTSHPVIFKNKITNEEFLYVSENTIDFEDEDGRKVDCDRSELLASILSEENQYVHRWEAGDLILYDNTQLLHRRQEFSGIRLLKALKIFPDGDILTPPLGRQSI
ncbi:TauD/TfdA family dioxygenase [Paraburkholderia sp. IMGN_8]|uniref:TauD/TfdA dioxygenase family protein n=1 Tax=Paraburkholderia sp. IMGN_8 TaxID=3136564 RepID=UPI0031014AA5